MILDILYHYFFAGKAKFARVVNGFNSIVVQKINTGRVQVSTTTLTLAASTRYPEVRTKQSVLSVSQQSTSYTVQVTNE